MEEKEEVKWKKDTLGVGGRRERDRDGGVEINTIGSIL